MVFSWTSTPNILICNKCDMQKTVGGGYTHIYIYIYIYIYLYIYIYIVFILYHCIILDGNKYGCNFHPKHREHNFLSSLLRVNNGIIRAELSPRGPRAKFIGRPFQSQLP